MVGLQHVASKFFILELFVILSSLCGFALEICFACLFSSLPVALAVTPLVLLPMMLFSGVFLNQGAIPSYVDWMKFISPMKWGFSGAAVNEFTDLEFPFVYGFRINGAEIVKQLGLNQSYMTIANSALIMSAMVIFLMACAYFALYRQTRDAMKSVNPLNFKIQSVPIELVQRKDENSK